MSKAAKKLEEMVTLFPDRFTTFYGRSKDSVPGIGKYYPERFGQETQDLMKELKSDDLKNVSPYLIEEGAKERGRRELSEAKLEFDRKFLGKN